MRMIKLLSGCYCILTFSGCVASYQRLRPESMEMRPDMFVREDSVHIQWRTDILKDSGNHSYARMEAKNGVSLVLFRMDNGSSREYLLPVDLLFIDSTDREIIPLTRDEALDALIKPVTPGDAPAVEVDMKVWRLGRTVNDIRRVDSHMKFITQMWDYYLEDSLLLPDNSVTGLLALPLPSSESFTVKLK